VSPIFLKIWFGGPYRFMLTRSFARHFYFCPKQIMQGFFL